MDPVALRIIDANFNRAGEGLRVLEEYVRLILGDAALCERAKGLRHDLVAAARPFGETTLLAARDIEGDVGTAITTEAESKRERTVDVARASAKRLSESLRCIEEYGKILDAPAAARIEKLRYEAYALEQAVFIGGPRRARLRTARLHVLVTESLCRGEWLCACERALEGGADVLQLREKTIDDKELSERARQLRDLTRRYDALFIVNDRPDIARLAEADGVHLGRRDLSVSDARRIVGSNALIGRTAHSVEEARIALEDRADYVAVGAMFPSMTKPTVAVEGPTLLREVAKLMENRSEPPVPLVAIGGITTENIAEFASLAGEIEGLQIAACAGVIGADDPTAAVRALRKTLCAAASNARAASDCTLA